MPAPIVSIVIPVFNKYEYTAKCLRAIATHTREVPHEVIVVDNASSDETERELSRRPGIRYWRNSRNLGFARGSNQGATMATGRFLLFLNNDTEPHAGWASPLVAELERDPAVAIAGSKLLYPDGTIQHAGVRFAYAMWQPIMPMHVHSRQPAAVASQRLELDAVTAACMLVRPEVFLAVGGFDEGYVNGYEDIDFCLEVRSRGRKIVFTPASVVTHHESVSEGRFDASAANTERLMARWIDRFDQPPFQFDADFRRTARPLAVAPDRPGVSVVVVADRSIWTIAPCLENIWYTTGAQDEIVIVDDTGGAAAGRFVARFAARHPERVRVVTAPRDAAREAGVRFPRAFEAGLASASRPLAALVGPNVRVAGDWLGRLVAHARADEGNTAGAITATLGDSARLGTAELLTPTGRTDPAVYGVDPPAAPAALSPATVTASFTLFGRTDRLRALAGTDAPFGPDPGATAQLMAQRGLRLVRALDVVVYRLNEVAGGADPDLRERYLSLQSAAPACAPAGEADQAADPTPAVSVIVVGGGEPALLRRCVGAVRRFTEGPLEVIVVENGAADGAEERSASGVDADGGAHAAGLATIRNPRNEGFAFAANQGLESARGPVVAILHDDVIVGPGWMRRARALLDADPSIGAVGPAMNECAGAQRMRMVSYAVNDVGDSGDSVAAFAQLWAAEHQGEIAIVPRLSGACLVLRREVVMRVGGFDTSFGLGKGADDDYTVRVARAGWKLAIALDVFVHHQGGATYRRREQDPRRAADDGWQVFCTKLNHPVTGAAPAELARLGAVPFDLTRDRLPLRYDHIYCPEAPPLALSCRQPVRFLCIADDLARHDKEGARRATGTEADGAPTGWRAVVLRFVAAFSGRDPVALVVRVEPPRPGDAEVALADVAAALARADISLADVPEILFEATAIPAGNRGSIYTAAQIFLRGDGERDQIRAREAAACGLALVDAKLGSAELRRALAARQTSR